MLDFKTLKVVNTYIYEVEFSKETDSRWSAVVHSLPGCNAWGHSEKEVLTAIHDTAKAYLEISLGSF